MNYEETFQQRGALYNQAHVISPDARLAEGQAMLRWLQPQPGETIVVAAAGGGFDARLIASALAGGSARIICIEPSVVFSALIPKSFETHNAPLDQIPLQDECADALVNLAALHHVENREQTFREWDRILKPGGRIVIGDVEEGSANGHYLNTIVDRYTPGGHCGNFLRPHELSTAFERLGYVSLKESLEEFDWTFQSCDEMVEFSKCIFGMTNASLADVHAGIEEFLTVKDESVDGSVAYGWSLRFFSGTKPVTSSA